MHLDLNQAAAFAIFAAAALHIETETARVVPADASRRQLREKFADRRKRAGVGDRIRARGAPDRALIDYNRLVDLLDAAQCPICARFFLRIVKAAKQRAPQDIVHQCRFSAPGNAGYAGETAQAEMRHRCSLDYFPRPLREPTSLLHFLLRDFGQSGVLCAAWEPGFVSDQKDNRQSGNSSPRRTSSSVPWATISPPRGPAPGPRSIM